jgi:dihydroflavonol-4-reductase
MTEACRVLVTGASGFIGSAITRAFLNAGFTVRAFIRPSSPRTNLLGLPIEIAEGDVMDRASIASALKSVRYLIHTAADYRLWSRNPSRLIAVNVEGTRNVMEEALKSGVDKIVYTSSVCTLAKGGPRDLADETFSLPARRAFNPYKRSKVLAEEIVRKLAAGAGLNAVIVNPSAPIGPRDIKPTPTGRVVFECAAGRMPAYLDTGLNLVHVDDVAQGHLAALERGIAGERYILGGENVHVREMLGEVARRAGCRPPMVKLSIPVVYPLAIASEAAGWITGKPPFVTRDSLRMAREYMYFDDTKARQALGYRSRPYEEGIAEAIGWFRSAGMLPRRVYAAGSWYKALTRS